MVNMCGRITKALALVVPLMMGAGDFCSSWSSWGAPQWCISCNAPYYAHVNDVVLGFEDRDGDAVAVTVEAEEDVTGGVACSHSGSWGYWIEYDMQRKDRDTGEWGPRIRAVAEGEWVWPGHEPQGCSARRMINAEWVFEDVIPGDEFRLTVEIWVSSEGTRSPTYQITYP
jgi:hypothetical protein